MTTLKKALFLDRDGVVNVDHGYVYEPEKFEFMPGIFDLIRHARDQGYTPLIITNQSGIARGYYTRAAFERLTRWMLARFVEQDAAIAGVYYCPHGPDEGCTCRKPQAGLLQQAIADHHIDPAHSVLIGDKPSDLQAAQKVGIPTRILLTPDAKEDSAATHTPKTLLDIIAIIKA